MKKAKVGTMKLKDDCILYAYPKNEFNSCPFIKISTPLKKDIIINLAQINKVIRYLSRNKVTLKG